MRHDERMRRGHRSAESGMTILELLAGITIISLLAAIAIPAFATWREGIEHRQTARNIVSLLREAQSKAIATNREHRVEFEAVNRRYGIRIGDRADRTNWASVPPVADWVLCASEVHFSSNVRSIQFNTDGTANGGTITVNNGAVMDTINVVVTRTGRVRVERTS